MADIVNATGARLENIRIAPDLAEPQSPALQALWQPREAQEPLRVCFLSRISPMKNLSGALEALSLVRNATIFNVFGPQEDKAYWAECAATISRLPAHISVCYHGSVPRNEVPLTLAPHDLFFLPTRGENYGHVIAEALGVGLPVLISDQTPWRGLQLAGVGWDQPLNGQGFATTIDYFASLDREAQIAKRGACIRYANVALSAVELLEQNRALFRPIDPRQTA
jgi:glycosyltransferase involved in cell wall biosynthesis